MTAQLRQIMNNELQKKKKPKKQKANCHFWRAGSKSRVLCMPATLNTTEGMGKPTKPTLRPDLWTYPYLHPT